MIHCEHIPKQFDAEFDAVRLQVIHMGRLVESHVLLAIEMLANGGVSLINRAGADDHRFHAMETEIDDMCNHIMASYRLIVDDLRVLMAIIKIIAELRHIGDDAEKIVRLIQQVSQQNSTLMLPRYSYMEIKQTATVAQDLLHKSLNSFACRDLEAAAQVVRHDDKKSFDKAINFLVSCMIENPRTIPAILEMLFVARAIERITGHAKNVSEYVVCMVKEHDALHITAEESKKGSSVLEFSTEFCLSRTT